MCMGIIPNDLKSEVLNENDFIDEGHLELETWWHRRVLVLQNRHLAEIAKKLLTSQVDRKLNSIRPDADADEIND